MLLKSIPYWFSFAVLTASSFTHQALANGKVVFPEGFLWGAATAAHQVEGNIQNDWTEWEKKPGIIIDGSTSKIAVDHYRRFDEDFALAQSMGHNTHRLSIEWARIEPMKGKWDWKEVDHYHEVFSALKKRGMKPMVTLHHFTNPQWVQDQGGWLNPETLKDFERFAGFAAREYGAEVDYWIPINEPNIYAFMAYATGEWLPQHRNIPEAMEAFANLIRGHALAYHALHRYDPGCKVGTSVHIATFEPFAQWSPLDHFAVHLNSKIFNRAFLRGVTQGDINLGIPGLPFFKSHFAPAKNSIDFVGVNYYVRWFVRGSQSLPNPNGKITDMGWEVFPEGIYRTLRLADDYAHLPDGRHLPIIITENGYAGPPNHERSAYLVQHLEQIARAINDGINVQGYIHWTLMDNFEWKGGYKMKFGLYTVDRSSEAALKRIPTPTVEVFRKIVQENAISEELIQTFGAGHWKWER